MAASNEEKVYLRDIRHTRDFIRTVGGDLEDIFGRDNMREWMRRTMITVPGDVKHRPNYGVGIKQFQNAVNRLSTQQEIALRIKENFERDDRIQEVGGVRIDYNDLEPEKTVIVVNVTLVGFTEESIEFTPFDGGISA